MIFLLKRGIFMLYTMETHGEIVNFSHIQIFLFRLKSRKTSVHFVAPGIELVFLHLFFFLVSDSLFRVS